MIDFLLNRKQPGQIQNLTVDLFLSENHTFRNDVSNNPVEEGYNINDHIFQHPQAVTLTGFITNSPIPASPFDAQSFTSALRGSTIGKLTKMTGKTRVQIALEELLRMTGVAYPVQLGAPKPKAIKPVPVDIITGLLVYTDMVLVNLTIPRDSSTGDALQFTAEFQQIRKVALSTILIDKVTNKAEAPSVKTQAPSKKNVGKQTPAQATQKQSTLVKVFDKIVTGR